MAAIGRNSMLAAETAAYSRRTPADEKGTFQQLEPPRRQFIFRKIAEYSGRVIKADDNFIVTFELPIKGTQSPDYLENGMVGLNISPPSKDRVAFLSGIQ